MSDPQRVLKFSYRGAPQTIAVMRRGALESQNHWINRKVCEQFCSGLASKDYLSEYLAAYQFALQRTRYMRDPRTVELVRAPYVVSQQILNGETPSLDCDDLSTLIASWVMEMGGQARFATVAFRDMFYEGRRQYSHVYVEAFEPRSSQWITLDPVAAERTKQMLSQVRARHYWGI